MTQIKHIKCCIAGGGPAGMMLGYLLARAGVETLVLEKHADFLRDFRGDTVHPSTMQIMRELGLLEDFLRLPHSQISAMSAEIGPNSFKVVDFARVPTACKFIALMPQWDFLNFLAQKAQRFSSFNLMLSAEVTSLIEEQGRIVGVRALTSEGELQVRSDLVVGCDGRASTVRTAAQLPVQDLGAPIDVLWFRLPQKPQDPQEILGHLETNSMLVTINRTSYWQCAFVIAKGGEQKVRAAGIEAFRQAVAKGARFLADRVNELKSFDDIKLLSVSVDRLTRWSKPGLLCIGDAAHAMSPVGGVGINLAIQDAVATANLIAVKLKDGTLSDHDLARVQKRRMFPVKLMQRGQVAVHNRILKPITSGTLQAIKAPWIVKRLDANAWLRRWPAQIIGVGIRPEHVRSPAVD